MSLPTIAVYGRKAEVVNIPAIQEIFTKIKELGCKILVYNEYEKILLKEMPLDFDYELFSTTEDLQNKAQYLFSIGGDGTLLSSIALVKDSNIPIVGVNIGRLGFLSSISINEISKALHSIVNGEYYLDKRSLLEVKSSMGKFEKGTFALNDVTVSKTDTSSMIAIDVNVNGAFFSTYWADGLIISTPTGSTAYNLSCGGPVISPQCNVFIITPIAPHNLNVRPIVIDDSSEIEIKVKSRSSKYLLSVDSEFESAQEEETIYLRKSGFHINILRFTKTDYLNTLRTKLLWGTDTRNNSKFAH